MWCLTLNISDIEAIYRPHPLSWKCTPLLTTPFFAYTQKYGISGSVLHEDFYKSSDI